MCLVLNHGTDKDPTPITLPCHTLALEWWEKWGQILEQRSWTAGQSRFSTHSCNCIQFSTCYDDWTTVDTQIEFDMLQCKLPYKFTNQFVEKYILDDIRLQFYTEW